MFTMESEVDIYIEDIIDNLDRFSKSDLEELKNEIEFHIDKKSDYSFNVKTLEDEYKFKVLKEMFKKYSLSELDEFNKK